MTVFYWHQGEYILFNTGWAKSVNYLLFYTLRILCVFFFLFNWKGIMLYYIRFAMIFDLSYKQTFVPPRVSMRCTFLNAKTISKILPCIPCTCFSSVHRLYVLRTSPTLYCENHPNVFWLEIRESIITSGIKFSDSEIFA